MALPDIDSSVGHSFGLEFDGVVIKQITEVSGLKIDQDEVELKQDTDSGNLVIKKLPGRPKAGEVTLTRGLTGDNSFEKWIKDSQFGKVSNARKGSAIIVFDVEGTAVKRYNLINARLKTLERGSLKAGDTSVLTEKLILTHEGYEADEAWHSGYEAAMCCQVPDGHDLCSDSVGEGCLAVTQPRGRVLTDARAAPTLEEGSPWPSCSM